MPWQRGVLWAVDSAAGMPEDGDGSLRGGICRGHPRIGRRARRGDGRSRSGVRYGALRRGRRCFAARVDDRIASYGWVSRRAEWVGEMDREFHPAAGEAYIWDCATLPSYQGQRLYSALLGYAIARLRDEGCRLVWIGSNQENLPSLRGFANAGFQPVAEA